MSKIEDIQNRLLEAEASVQDSEIGLAVATKYRDEQRRRLEFAQAQAVPVDLDQWPPNSTNGQQLVTDDDLAEELEEI